jgi:hypothetical protein
MFEFDTISPSEISFLHSGKLLLIFKSRSPLPHPKVLALIPNSADELERMDFMG